MGERLIRANINYKWDAQEMILKDVTVSKNVCFSVLNVNCYQILTVLGCLLSTSFFLVSLKNYFTVYFHLYFECLSLLLWYGYGKGEERNHLFQKAWDLSWFYLATSLLTAVTRGHYICEQKFHFLHDGKHSVLSVIYRWYINISYFYSGNICWQLVD